MKISSSNKAISTSSGLSQSNLSHFSISSLPPFQETFETETFTYSINEMSPEALFQLNRIIRFEALIYH